MEGMSISDNGRCTKPANIYELEERFIYWSSSANLELQAVIIKDLPRGRVLVRTYRGKRAVLRSSLKTVLC